MVPDVREEDLFFTFREIAKKPADVLINVSTSAADDDCDDYLLWPNEAEPRKCVRLRRCSSWPSIFVPDPRGRCAAEGFWQEDWEAYGGPGMADDESRDESAATTNIAQTTVPAHKIVLSAVSGYFRTLFENASSEDSSDEGKSTAEEFSIPYSAAVFRRLMDIVYARTDLLVNKRDDLVGLSHHMRLIEGAIYFDIGFISQKLLQKLRNRITATNVARILNFAAALGHFDLVQACFAFVDANLPNLLQNPYFLRNASFQTMLRIVSEKAFSDRVLEIDLFRAILKWFRSPAKLAEPRQEGHHRLEEEDKCNDEEPKRNTATSCTSSALHQARTLVGKLFLHLIPAHQLVGEVASSGLVSPATVSNAVWLHNQNVFFKAHSGCRNLVRDNLCKSSLEIWKHTIAPGMRVLAKDSVGKWYPATVERVEGSSAQEPILEVSFEGWASRWNEYIDLPRGSAQRALSNWKVRPMHLNSTVRLSRHRARTNKM